jgi:hypothetical protein
MTTFGFLRWASNYLARKIEDDISGFHAIITRALPEPLVKCMNVESMKAALRDWDRQNGLSRLQLEQTLDDWDENAGNLV